MSQIVDGKKIASTVYDELKPELNSLRRAPKLTVFLIGENRAAVSYVQAKQKKGRELGFKVEVRKFGEDISQEEFKFEIGNIKQSDGIIIQLPLPAHMNKQKVLDAVPVDLDVDALTQKNKTDLIQKGGALFVPPAAAAVLTILDFHEIELKDKNIVIVGTGDLVGKPLSALLLKRGVDFELANQYTENLISLLARADVVISGVGKEGLITGEMIKPGAVVIDAGTTGTEAGVISGDVDKDSVAARAGLLSPVPGGVGPVTIAMLFKNVVRSARRRRG